MFRSIKSINIDFLKYSQRARSIKYLQKHSEYIKADTVKYFTMRRSKGGTFIKHIEKVEICKVNDKNYIFHNGIMTLPHGHCLLKEISSYTKRLTDDECQRDETIKAIIDMENEVLESDENLKILKAFYEQNSNIIIPEPPKVTLCIVRQSQKEEDETLFKKNITLDSKIKKSKTMENCPATYC